MKQLELYAGENWVLAKVLSEALDSPNTAEMRSALESHAEKHAATDLRLDLSHVQRLDSGAIAELLVLNDTCKEANKRLIILNPSPRVSSIIELMRLHKTFLLQFS